MPLQLNCGKQRSISTDLPAFIMGIVNATEDSFFNASRSTHLQKNIDRALALEAQGADILDIGGESTRPGSVYVSVEEELERVIPLVTAIRKRSAIPLSVDTRKSAVMELAFAAGAEICNDVSALEDDARLGPLIAKAGGSVVLMHKQGIPLTMQQDRTDAADIKAEVQAYLAGRMQYAIACGIPKARIMLDYGIGFGKTAADNYKLISGTASFTQLGCPLLVGISRKSCISALLQKTADTCLTGTLAAEMYAVQQGAAVVRVHDVGETRDMLLMLRELQKYGNT